MIKITTIFLLLIILSCASNQDETATYKVEFKGALKAIMQKGDISAKVALSEFKERPHFYALGAVENLKGEIQIFDSKPIITYLDGENLEFDYSFEKKASLLVYSSVEKWMQIDIPHTVFVNEQLEIFIEQTAREKGIDTSKPFPFLVEGVVNTITWHIVDWKDGDTEHSHEKHRTSGLHGTARDREVVVLGFYSDSHHAIFTHHTTKMHMHVKFADESLAGHVDLLSLGKGMKLFLPE